MVGFHNQTIYSLADNDLCVKCANSELIFGDSTFSGGGFICLPHGLPNKQGCPHFVQAPTKRIKNREIIIKFMLVKGFQKEPDQEWEDAKYYELC